MAEKDKRFERVDQRTIQTILLDEVTGRLKDITELLSATIPRGVVENIEIQLIGVQWQKLKLVSPWHSFSLVNTSASATVYVRVNDANSVAYPVLAGGIYQCDMKTARITEINLRTTVGASVTVNLSGIR